MKYKKIITSTLCITLLLSTISNAMPNKGVEKTLDIYKGIVNLDGKEWKEKIEYIVGKDDIPFDFDKTYEYKDNEYEGTLNAVKVTITPRQKIKDTYYVKENKDFTKYVSGNFGNKINGNFPPTHQINEDGYVGDIGLKSVTWKDNWVRGRNEYISTTHETGWTTGNLPPTINYNYHDPLSGSTINTNLNLVKTVDRQETTSYEYSESYGDRYNYSQRNENLGYMSDNTKDYYGGEYRFSDPTPRRPSDYYGPESDKTGWELVDAQWADDKPYSADEVSNIASIRPNLVYQNGGWWWKSESGRLNKYRRGTYLKYRKPIPFYKYKGEYGGYVNLPDYIQDYTGDAIYQGTLSKQVEKIKYICNYWDVNITYQGNIALKDTQVSGNIVPNPAKQGSQITFDISTRYYPNKLEISIPSELQSLFGKNMISLNIKEEAFLNTKHQEVLNLYIPETIDREGKRLREPYKFNVKAIRSDGNSAQTILKLDVSGSILENLKTVIIN